MNVPWHLRDNELFLSVRLTPKSSRDEIDGIGLLADGRSILKVRVRAVPENGKPNTALLRLLAKTTARVGCKRAVENLVRPRKRDMLGRGLGTFVFRLRTGRPGHKHQKGPPGCARRLIIETTRGAPPPRGVFARRPRPKSLRQRQLPPSARNQANSLRRHFRANRTQLELRIKMAQRPPNRGTGRIKKGDP